MLTKVIFVTFSAKKIIAQSHVSFETIRPRFRPHGAGLSLGHLVLSSSSAAAVWPALV